jgi:outer membrane protein assembly factor BamB
MSEARPLPELRVHAVRPGLRIAAPRPPKGGTLTKTVLGDTADCNLVLPLRRSGRCEKVLLLACFLPAAAWGAVSGWRGDGSGCFSNANPPLHWDVDTGQNIRWQTRVGKGQSSPALTEDRVFISAEPCLLLCLDRKTGAVLWKQTNSYDVLPGDVPRPDRPPATHRDCGYATPTPVTDGRSVYAFFGTGLVVCSDLEGRRQWVRCFNEELATDYGRTTSPLLVSGKLVVAVRNLRALDAPTGRTLWEATNVLAAYGTPALVRAGAHEVIVTPNGECLRLSDGRVLATNLAQVEYTSPAGSGNTVFFVGKRVAAFRLEADAAAEIRVRKLWDTDQVTGDFFASPLGLEGLLCFVNNEGIFYGLETATGRKRLEKPLPIPAAATPGREPANLYSSLTLVGRHLLANNDAGDTLVFLTNREVTAVATNHLDKGSGASPVADGRELFLRAGDRLYCVGPP